MKIIRVSTDLELTLHDFPGEAVSMLVDEEGLLKENVVNIVGSHLYEVDKHGYPIMGNILFVGEWWTEEGIDFCGIEESVLEELEEQLNIMIRRIEMMKQEVKNCE